MLLSLRIIVLRGKKNLSVSRGKEREKFIIRQPPIGGKMIMIVKTPGSQMGSPAAAEGGGEVT